MVVASDMRQNTMPAIATISKPPRGDYKPILAHAATQKITPHVIKFDPKKHLVRAPTPAVVTMKDIGYADDVGVSSVAVSQPFQLFSSEAIQQMRREIFQQEVLERCSFRSNLASCQLRGYAPRYAPFTYDAWKHPETLALISKIAGVDLVPAIDYDIAHINFSVKSDKQNKEELATIAKQKRFFDEDEGIAGCPWEDDKPIVGWHTDSYPFVAVLMMSDCTNMVGGETALRTANGEVMKVRGPQEGCAVIMQGRYITHQALRTLGTKERITAVTSFRPRSAAMKDDTMLATVRPISDLSEIYYEYAEYRLEILEERIRHEYKEMVARRRAHKKFDTLGHKKFLGQIMAFLEQTNTEIIEDSKVIPGYLPEVNIPDVVASPEEYARAIKRTRVE